MRKWTQWLAACGLMGVGYLLGTTGAVDHLWAQNAAETATAGQAGAVSEETQKKIAGAYEALKAAQEALEGESLYVPATVDLNAFGVLSGGLNAIDDLESGRGVDPETFVGLYADRGTDEVKAKLTKDEKGRLVYNGKLVQMYPISRLRKAFDSRNALTGAVPATSAATEPAE